MGNKKRRGLRHYQVGYKHPPEHTRFKPGQSGNPAGRPKGTPNFATALDRALKEQVLVTQNGRSRSISKLEAMVVQMVNKAIGGDARARQQTLSVLHILEPNVESQAARTQDLDEADRHVVQGLMQRMQKRAKAEGDDEDK